MSGIRPAAESASYSASCYRRILQEVGVAMSYTRGVSMRPLIFSGIGYVAIVPVAEPQVDDMLLFEQMRGGKTACILHRLVAVDGDVFVTRGDNCLCCERIVRGDIIGKVENVYWTVAGRSSWSPHLWLPRLCGAERHAGSLVLNVRSSGYLRYVKVWNALWPVRRVFYRARAFAAAVYHKAKNAVPSEKRSG